MVLVTYLLTTLSVEVGLEESAASVVGRVNQEFVLQILDRTGSSAVLGNIFEEDVGLGGHDDLCGCG